MRDTAESKAELRRAYKEKRRGLDKETKKRWDSAICEKVMSLECFERASSVLLFYPSFSEPDVLPIARRSLELGKKIAFPLCDVESHTICFKYVSSLDELVSGSYSIPEPPESNLGYLGEEDAICIVPALTFDRDGFRLGYGGGYYDRFLTWFSGDAVGVVYSDFICGRLPRSAYDIKVGTLVSEEGRVFINVKEDTDFNKQI